MHDPSPKSYEHLVDRLLASPRYGEQWGRHWLDVVRFAESDGYEYDTHRPDAYRFRDYVVQSFNEDKRYDQFVKEQLAGDELDSDNETYLVASGFNRLGPLRKNAGNQNVASSRNEVLTEMTNIVGAAFLGVTVGCARCHDHKFDPFRQSDYYRIEGFFAQAQPNDILRATKEEQDAWHAKVDPLQQEMRQLQTKVRQAPEEEKGKLQAELDAIDEKMPLPLTAIYAVKDAPREASPIHTQDAENSLLWKFSRRRLEAEEIRDSMLAISGKLNPKIGGPSVLVPIDRDLVKMLKRPQYWVATKDKSEYEKPVHFRDVHTTILYQLGLNQDALAGC